MNRTENLVTFEKLDGAYRGLIGGILTVEVIKNDITKEATDAITNAANGRLMHGGGVAGAIARAGGPQINIESRKYVEEHGKIPTGQVGVTGPGDLNCKHVIHAVGPIWDNNATEDHNINLLRHAVFNTLVKANELECESVAIPAISSGIFGFPKPLCAKVFFYTLTQFVLVAKQKNIELKLKTVRLTNFDEETCVIFKCQFDCTFS